jgi:hypothetical protein
MCVHLATRETKAASSKRCRDKSCWPLGPWGVSNLPRISPAWYFVHSHPFHHGEAVSQYLVQVQALNMAHLNSPCPKVKHTHTLNWCSDPWDGHRNNPALWAINEIRIFMCINMFLSQTGSSGLFPSTHLLTIPCWVTLVSKTLNPGSIFSALGPHKLNFVWSPVPTPVVSLTLR